MGGSRGKVLLTVQQISFAKLLAGNDKRTRDKGLKKLRNYLTSRAEIVDKFSEDDAMRIWKGLYFSMWMSDKPLIQEELAEKISSLVHCFKNIKTAVLFIGCFFSTMGIEWFGIDQHRLDKFLMLVRRFLRQTLKYCHQRNWSEDLVKEMSSMFCSTVLSDNSSQLGLTLHFMEIFLEELAKVSKGVVSQQVFLELLRPFLSYLSKQDDERRRSHVVKHVFHYLMKQSDLGIEYEETFAAWKGAGFPGNSCEAMERIEMENLSESESELNENLDSNVNDPRAGKVDVILPQLQFDAQKVAELILEHAKVAPALRNRKILYQLAEQFGEMATGKYPLAFKLTVPEGTLQKKKGGKRKKSELWKAAESLILFEEGLKEDDTSYKGGDEEAVLIEEGRNGKRKLEDEEEEAAPPHKLKRGEPNVISDSKAVISRRLGRRRNHSETGCISDNVLSSLEQIVNIKSKEQKPKVLKLKTALNVKRKTPIKVKKLCVHSFSEKQRSTPLKNIQTWEVTDICAKSNQNLQAIENSLSSPLLGERRNSPAKADCSPSVLNGTAKVKSPKELTPSSKKLLLNGTPGSTKKVNIVLQMNKEQRMADYEKAVKMSPSIPFDATKKPTQGVLKPSPFNSPINPFYRRSGRRFSNVL